MFCTSQFLDVLYWKPWKGDYIVSGVPLSVIRQEERGSMFQGEGLSVGRRGAQCWKREYNDVMWVGDFKRGKGETEIKRG